MTLILSLATYLISNQLTFAKEMSAAYESRSAINVACQLIQKELDEGRDISSGEVTLSTGTVTVKKIEAGYYRLTFTSDELPSITQEKSLDTRKMDKYLKQMDKIKKEIEKEKSEKEAAEKEKEQKKADKKKESENEKDSAEENSNLDGAER